MKDKLISMDALSAPQLWLRRTTAIYVYPWSQLLSATLIYFFGYRIGIWARVLGVYWLAIFLLCILIDVTVAQSRIMRLSCGLNKLLHKKFPQYNNILSPQVPEDQFQVFFTCQEPPLFEQRYIIRWVCALLIVLVTWGFAWYQPQRSLAELSAFQANFTFFLILSGTLAFANFVTAPTPFLSPKKRRSIWIMLGISGFIAAWFALKPTISVIGIIMGSATLFLLHYTVVLITQRLWIGQKIWGEVIRIISMECLDWPETSPNLAEIPALIGTRMRFDHVYILELAPDEQTLIITAEYGDSTSVLGREIPISSSLTGRAFRAKETVIWNNVSACGYYHTAADKDETKAEMAVPIIHQGVVYGILDVQANVKGAYTPGDQHALETIAGILGAAIAVDKREQFFHEATALWQHVMTTNNNFDSEKDVFKLFAEFAQDRLGVDLVIYYPLSLAGYPVQEPYILGKLHQPEFSSPADRDPESGLLKLITTWEAYFEPCITPQSRLARLSTADNPSFVERESIKSACFLPVGVRQERMGTLFLNFRQDKQFDQTFKFSVVSLAQSLALATAQVRYRELVYTSFARPEMSVHSLIGRYGFKTSISASLKNSALQQTNNSVDALLKQMDQFIIELRLADSAFPPDFSQQSFQDQLQTFKSSLPAGEDGRRPRLRLSVDPNIEKEFTTVKLVLYRVITEAITNAIVHGNANRIQVRLERKHQAIEVEISNDGHPLPPEAEKRQSEHGIYSLLYECRKKLGANTDITNLPEENGVVVCAAIPSLIIPPNYEDI